MVASAGNPHFMSFVRSAVKMFQALPLVEDGVVEHFGLTDEELALITASHGGEPFHLEGVRSILKKIDAPEDALACGAHPPMHSGSAEALTAACTPPTRIHNNCSGKHAGMLALARRHGWPIEGYHQLTHPVQQRMLKTMAQWCALPTQDISVAVDGCGVPTFCLQTINVAAACARFAAAAREQGSAAGRIVAAMTKCPGHIAGTDRLCTDLIRATSGRLFAKVGAEGYYCAGIPESGLGLALKVEDGAKRASEPTLLAVLREVGELTESEMQTLSRYAQPVVLNTRGEAVGHIRVRRGRSTPR
jgi:L-asparaginase II